MGDKYRVEKVSWDDNTWVIVDTSNKMFNCLYVDKEKAQSVCDRMNQYDLEPSMKKLMMISKPECDEGDE